VVWRAAIAILEGGPGSDDDGGGEDFDGLLGLALARLDQQVAARFQPSLRRGGHPPLNVKPVRATIAPPAARVCEHPGQQADRPDRYVGHRLQVGAGRHIGS
jgi:hypothetical protein